jgi:phosphate ABC transporter permease protein PstC
MKQDKIIHIALTIVALSAISSLSLITIFVFKEGLPIILKVGARNFFLSGNWSPSEGQFGIMNMIAGSLAVTAGAIIIGAVFGLGCAVVLTQFAPRQLVVILKPAIEVLAGIPSVVYGFIGVVVLVPFVRENLGGPGLSIFTASIVLGIMVLPTITSISVDVIQAVPRSYRDGSIALGATRWQTTYMVIIKAAKSGIIAAFILGMGRAIGETMAVIMVAGNALELPHSILDSVRTLTSGIALEMGYASGEHRQALFATGVTLFIIIMILNSLAMRISHRQAGKAAKK